MKRYCKNVDIMDRDFVIGCIQHYFSGKTGPEIGRRSDIQKVLAHHDGSIESIADDMIRHYRSGDLGLMPVKVSVRHDPSSQKDRTIAIENAWQQLYDQIAADGLLDATRIIGEYQCTCLKNQPKVKYMADGSKRTIMTGRGQVWAKDRVFGWWSDPEIRYCVKMDIRHNYATINHAMLMAFLDRHVCNADLLNLIGILIETTPEVCREREGCGLMIGSVLSITLDALYLSQVYHHMAEDCYKIRNAKTGQKRVNLVKHIMMWMDDIYLFASSEKDAKAAAKDCIRFCSGLGLSIKEDYQIIRKIDGDRQNFVDCVGYKVYPDHVTLRRRDYVKAKRYIKRGSRNMSLHTAQVIVSHRGEIMNSDSFRFRKKYHVKQISRNARKVISDYEKGIIRQ